MTRSYLSYISEAMHYVTRSSRSKVGSIHFNIVIFYLVNHSKEKKEEVARGFVESSAGNRLLLRSRG